MLTASTNRSLAFESLVHSTLDVLEMDPVSCRLGETATETAKLLQNAFLVPRKIGTLLLPSDQVSHNNIGIHPILPTDATLPNPYYYLSTPAIQTKTEEYDTGKSLANPATWMYPLAFAGNIPPAGIVRARKRTLADGEQMRDLMISGRSLHYSTPLSRAARAANIIHEIDHVLKRREAIAEGMDNEALNRDTFLVALERSGYDKTAAVLEETGVAPTDISVDSVFKTIEDDKPSGAARKLFRLAKTYLRQSPDTTSLKDNTFALRSYGAAALTRMFQNGDGSVSKEEVSAYKSAHYIQ